MSSSSSSEQPPHEPQLNPRANVFILVNLGCEMLFVIDQRLKAQQIGTDKSIQVIHDITTVLLDPKFIDSLILGSTHANAELFTVEHCKFMLNDLATCSIMRLDANSMDKLWNLMTMIYKWQLFVSRHQHHLLDITFRHLDAINKLYPDAKRHMLIDFTKNTLLDFWNTCGEAQQLAIYRTNKAWHECFNTKISLLIRLGFQMLDGSFVTPQQFAAQPRLYQEFAQSIGANVYVQSAELLATQRKEAELAETGSTNRVDQLAALLNIAPSAGVEDLQPIDAKQFQQQYEQNLQQCNILFDDLDVNGSAADAAKSSTTTKQRQATPAVDLNAQLFSTLQGKHTTDSTEFVRLETVYNRTEESSTATGASSAAGLNKQLLDLYSKMN